MKGHYMIEQKETFCLELGLDKDLHKQLVFNWVNPGKFMMGSPLDEPGRSDYDDEPQFEVTISKGFWLSKFLITNMQWIEVMGEGSYPITAENANVPVTNINWFESSAFCEKLNRTFKDILPFNYQFRLPTEAQWEYACRAGTQTIYYNGDFVDDLGKIAWHDENSFGRVHPVGQKAPNAWMFYDMLGNVAEWCYDDFQPYPNNPTADWIGINRLQVIKMKMIRGGMWTAPPSDGSFRCSCRMSFLSDKGLPHLGFRISLRTLEEGES